MDIDAGTLQSLLIQETINQCGHEERKGQLSMSWLSLPTEEILKRVRNGCAQSDESKLLLYQGTHSEKGMRERLDALCLSRHLPLYAPRVISAFGGRLTGHTDGSIENTVIEIKTVPDGKILREMASRGRVPFKVYSQVNAYMLWGEYRDALVIYEARGDGALWVTHVTPNKDLQKELDSKVRDVLRQI